MIVLHRHEWQLTFKMAKKIKKEGQYIFMAIL